MRTVIVIAAVILAVCAFSLIWSWCIWNLIVYGYGGPEKFAEHQRRNEEIHQHWLDTFDPINHKDRTATANVRLMQTDPQAWINKQHEHYCWRVGTAGRREVSTSLHTPNTGTVPK